MEKELHISISRGNAKMGAIPSLSLPPITTCSKEACKHCGKKCYALKITKLRPKTVGAAYQRNLDILQNDPDKYWREVNAALSINRFFRFGVSGDIYNKEYLVKMCELARKNSHCQILCFTKQFDIVNEYLSEHRLPKNLHLIFSAWRGMEMKNPYNLPEAHVLYKDGYTTAKDGAKYCSGLCMECAVGGKNCFSLKKRRTGFATRTLNLNFVFISGLIRLWLPLAGEK